METISPEAVRSSPGFWLLVREGEPYRVLFPLGAALGILGVMLWPLFFWRLFPVYPGQIHARVMIEGFLSCFVAGFLGTAGPRLLASPPLKTFEILSLGLTFSGTVVLHVLNLQVWGDAAFASGLAILGVGLIVRLCVRKDSPPPSFVLVALGLFSALSGVSLQILDRSSTLDLPVWIVRLGQLLLYQGFILLPIMGVGAFLLPRFVGLQNRQEFPESMHLPSGWLPRAIFAVGCGFVILLSFWLEAIGELRWGYGLRGATVLLFFSRELPLHRANAFGGSLGLGLRLALVSVPLGYLLMTFWPSRASSFLHVVFISGFSLLTFVVASRVILGHSDQSARFNKSIPSVLILASLVFLAMLTRVTADWMPQVLMSHYAYAALSWAVGVAIWGFYILPFVRIAEPES